MMRYVSIWSVGASCFLLLVGLAGCHKPAVTEKPVPDPLLTSKKPVEGRPHPADDLRQREDLLPPPPAPGFDLLAPPANDAPVAHLLGARPLPR